MIAFQRRVFKRTALIFVFALTVVAGTACEWGGMYVVKSLPVGGDRSILIMTHDDYEISRSIYYQVRIGQETVVATSRICNAAKDPNSLNYKILLASGGNLIAVYEGTNPERILVLHDFSKGTTWPRGADDEWSAETDSRGERLLQQLQREYTTQKLRLNRGAACGIKIPDKEGSSL